MIATDAPLVIYVDVDDTMVRSVGAKRIPIPAVIQQIRALWQQGAELYCWSSGGADYARESATEFGIGYCFVAFLPKPNVVIDGQRIADWRRFLEVHPIHDPTASVQDYRSQPNGPYPVRETSFNQKDRSPDVSKRASSI